MKRVLLYNHSGCENRGCEAIVRATTALLRAHGAAHVELSSAQPEYDRGLHLPGVDRVVSQTIAPLSLDRLINSLGYRLGQPREHEVARRFAPVVRAGKRADLALSIGGDTYCYAPQEHMRVINGRLRRAEVPLALFGASIDPERLDAAMLRDLAAYDLIVARESITAEALAAHGLPVRRFRDPAFSLEAESAQLPAAWREGHTVGLNISPLVLDKMGKRGEAIRVFAALLRHILKATDDAVCLFAHVTWAHDDDRWVVQRLLEAAEGNERVFALPDGLTAPQIKGAIGRMRLLLTARTHASIAGYSQGVPTLVVSYSVKAQGIARDIFGNERGHLVDSRSLTEPKPLMDAFDALSERADAERALLTRRMPAYMKDADGAMEALQRLSR